jgi:hypothetical protein
MKMKVKPSVGLLISVMSLQQDFSLFFFYTFVLIHNVVLFNCLQAETDRVKGLGIMIFQIEATFDDLVITGCLAWVGLLDRFKSIVVGVHRSGHGGALFDKLVGYLPCRFRVVLILINWKACWSGLLAAVGKVGTALRLS